MAQLQLTAPGFLLDGNSAPTGATPPAAVSFNSTVDVSSAANFSATYVTEFIATYTGVHPVATTVLNGLRVRSDYSSITLTAGNSRPSLVGIAVEASNAPNKIGKYAGIAVTNPSLGIPTTYPSSPGVTGLSIVGGSCNSTTGGLVTNYGINVVTIPTGTAAAGGTTNNYGLAINGSGGGAATANWAIYNTSTAPNLHVGPTIQRLAAVGTTTLTSNGDMTVEATSNTQLTFRYRGSDGVVRSGSITLT